MCQAREAHEERRSIFGTSVMRVQREVGHQLERSMFVTSKAPNC